MSKKPTFVGKVISGILNFLRMPPRPEPNKDWIKQVFVKTTPVPTAIEEQLKIERGASGKFDLHDLVPPQTTFHQLRQGELCPNGIVITIYRDGNSERFVSN
jgi:hypothetical protein